MNFRSVTENSMFHLGVDQGFSDFNCMGCPYHLIVPGEVNCQHQEYLWRKSKFLFSLSRVSFSTLLSPQEVYEDLCQ